MPPPRPPVRKRAEGARRADFGITPDTLAHHAKTVKQPPPFKELSEGSEKRHAAAEGIFNTYVESRPGRFITHAGLQLHSLEEWVSKKLGFPPQTLLQPMFYRWAAGVSGKVREDIQSAILFKMWWTFCARYRRMSWEDITKESREAGLDFCKTIISDLGLPHDPAKRTPLDPSSIPALVEGALELLGTLHIIQRLCIALFIDLESVTGGRPSTFLHVEGSTKAKASGAKFGNFQIWAVPTPDGPNEFYAYYLPPYGKTKQSAGMRYPLLPTNNLLTHSTFLVLLLLMARGGITFKTLQYCLSPEFTKKGPRRIPIAKEWYDQYVFINSRGKPITSCWMSKYLARLGSLLGIEGRITAYCLRHMVIKALVEAGARFEDIQQAAGHAHRKSGTKAYLGRHIIFDTFTSLGLNSGDPALRARVRNRAGRPNPEAPTTLNSAQIAEALECPKVKEQEEEVQALLKSLPAKDEWTKDDIADVRAAKNLLHSRKNSAKDRKLCLVREEWFEQRRSRQAGELLGEEDIKLSVKYEILRQPLASTDIAEVVEVLGIKQEPDAAQEVMEEDYADEQTLLEDLATCMKETEITPEDYDEEDAEGEMEDEEEEEEEEEEEDYFAGHAQVERAVKRRKGLPEATPLRSIDPNIDRVEIA